MDGRYYTSSDYRFGFQGQEGDDEVSGEGNSYAFKYRIHDARLGRFLSIDPLSSKFAWNSPYAFAENKVLEYLEFEGLETVPKDQIWNLDKVAAPICKYESDKYMVARVEGFGSRIHKITGGDNAGNYFVRQYVGTSTDGYSMYKDAFIVGANRISEFANRAKVESVDEGTPGMDVWNEYRALAAGKALGADKYGGSLSNFDYKSYLTYQWTDPEKLVGMASLTIAARPRGSNIRASSTTAQNYRIGQYEYNLVDGKLKFTNGMSTKGTFDVVVTNDGKLLIGDGHYKMSNSASSVRAAGSITVGENGVIKSYNNYSGHYKSGQAGLESLGNELNKLGAINGNTTSTNVGR